MSANKRLDELEQSSSAALKEPPDSLNSVLRMAGGGIAGGTTIGATDDFGFNAVTDKVHVNDLHATRLGLLGIDHKELSSYFEGRYHRLTDVGGMNNLAARLVRR